MTLALSIEAIRVYYLVEEGTVRQQHMFIEPLVGGYYFEFDLMKGLVEAGVVE